MVLTFHPSKLKSLGITFPFPFRANKILGLVKNYDPKVLKYLGNTSCIVFFSKSL